MSRCRSPAIDNPQRGLKDHEIAQLVNAIRDRLEAHSPQPDCLRALISTTVVAWLADHGLKIDP